MKKNLYFALAAVTMLLESCSIQQRVYQPGLYIQWKGNHEAQVKDEAVSTEQTAQVEIAATTENEVLVIAENSSAANSVVNNASQEMPIIEKTNKLTKKDVKQAVQELKQEVAALVSNESAVASVQTADASSESTSRPEPWVYILLIFLVPFGTTISMYLYEGNWTKKVTTNLILTLLCGIPGLIHALVNIFGKK